MTESIYCPDCKPVTNRSGRRLDPDMECVEHNYSGTGEDVYQCSQCGHVFFVSYKIDAMTRAEDWEDKEEVARLAKEREERGAINVVNALLRGTPELQEKARQYGEELLRRRDAERQTDKSE